MKSSLLMLFCLLRCGLAGDVRAKSLKEDIPVSFSPSEQDKGECDALGLEEQKAVGDAVAKLGFKLLQNLQPGPEQPNVVLSPLSISLAFAQLALGAMNETEEHLLRALHANTLPGYYKTLSCLQDELTARAIKVASRIYLKQGFALKKDFVRRSLQLFKSAPRTLNSIEEVNQWVEEATNNNIHNFLSTLPPNVALMLINAVYFKGQWKFRFDERFTTKELFYIDKQTSVKVDMMTGSKYPLSTFVDVDNALQVARFPFQGNTSLLIVMPLSSDNLSTVAANLKISDLYEYLPNEIPMTVKLPKLKLEYKQDLQQALTNMGLGSLFSGPNLSGIAVGPLVVSGVQHASSMELNEEGAEASAATSITLVRTVPILTVNMPFIFAIVDDITHTPLFLGMVTNPNPGETIELSDDPEISSSNTNMPRDKLQNDDPYWDNMLHV